MVATRNITDLNSLVTPQADDILLIVQRLSSTSTEAKQITWANVQEALQDIVGSLATSTGQITFTYDDTNGTLSANVVDNTSTQKSIYSEGGSQISTRQEANFVDGVGINVAVADNPVSDRADITVSNTGIVSSINNTVAGTVYEFLSNVTVNADGSKTLELRPLKLGSNRITATYTDNNQSLTLDIDPSTIDINTLNTATPLSVSVGGTGASTAAVARNNLGAAKSGSNSDISALSGLTTPLSINQGGTGDSNAAGALLNLGGLNSCAGVGAAGEQIVYQTQALVSGAYRAEFKGIKPNATNYITVATDGSDIALGANPNNILDAVSGARNVNGARITNAGNPINSNDLATKAYVDSQTTGLNVKDACRVASTGNIAGTYDSVSQTLTAGSNGVFTIDQITPNLNDRVLLKDQSTGSENGIYRLSTAGDASTPWVLTRADDFNISSEVGPGSFTFVTEGFLNGGRSYVQSTVNPVLDFDTLNFVVFGQSTIGNNTISNAKLEAVDESTIKGRAAGVGTGNVSDLTPDQVLAVLNTASVATLDYNRISFPAVSDTNSRVSVYLNQDTSATGTRRSVRLVEGSNISITGVDDSANEEAVVTITSNAAPLDSPTFTGTVTIPSGASIADYAPLDSPTFTGSVTIPSGASIAGYAALDTAQTFTAAQRGDITTVSDNPSGSLTLDFSATNNFSVTLSGSAGNTRVLANPTNVVAGQSGIITVIQSSSGTNLLTYGSYWDFRGSNTSISTSAGAIDTIAYYCVASNVIRAVIIKGS